MPLLPTINSPADLKKLSIDDLPVLAQEIREAIFAQVSKVGGHLAPNLGVVELSIALHYVFDFGHDRLLFDVGHQCYPHKLLTGRMAMLPNLRTRAGMAGFPEPRESAYDLFSVGHAGTAISTAVGMARGDLLNNESFVPDSRPNGRRVVSLIGDASIVNGLAMEGLNGAGTLKRQFLVILNDNGMSIAKPQGAVAGYFDRVRLSNTYSEIKKKAKDVLHGLPGGDMVKDAYHRMSEMAKAAVTDSWFEHFGLVTVGPVDGHDLRSLIEVLTEAKHFERPMVLHVKTVKGKGYQFAEGDATKFHSPAAFNYDPDSCRVEIKSEGRSFTSAFGEALAEMMKRDPKIVACTAAMPGGTGIDKVFAAHPERTFDSGICESHALDMMAGMAKTGWKPFFAVYSTFLQRAFDQAFQEVSLQGLPVRLCLDRAGLVGGDGAVHHGFCDISILRVLPQAAITAAADEPSMLAAMEFMRTYDAGLSACRWPRDNCSPALARFGPCPPFELGKARALIEHKQPDAAVLAYGTMVISALEAVDAVAPEVRTNLYDARFAKPVDKQLIKSLLERRIPIITVEDHGPHGGFGSAIIEAAAEMGLDAGLITKMALPDAWIYQDSRKDQLAEAGLDPASIARRIREAAAGRNTAGTDRNPVVEVRSPVGAKV
jgi:1-deoxy-D-xylulose-5-phosphate synthase